MRKYTLSKSKIKNIIYTEMEMSFRWNFISIYIHIPYIYIYIYSYVMDVAMTPSNIMWQPS